MTFLLFVKFNIANSERRTLRRIIKNSMEVFRKEISLILENDIFKCVIGWFMHFSLNPSKWKSIYKKIKYVKLYRQKLIFHYGFPGAFCCNLSDNNFLCLLRVIKAAAALSLLGL